MVELILNSDLHSNAKDPIANFLIITSKEFKMKAPNDKIVINEAIRGLNLGEYSSGLMIRGACNGLGIEIFQIYPQQLRTKGPNAAGDVMNKFMKPMHGRSYGLC